MRVTDSLLPQIATEFSTTVGAASIIAAAYTMTHGSVQLVTGPLTERLGKYRTVALACAICAVIVLLSGLSQSLGQLAAARLCAGAFAAFVIPASMAFIGDVVPYEQRQKVLGRYLSGMIIGQLFGQAAGGILGDLFGWRAVFFVISALLTLACIGLVRELLINPATRTSHVEGNLEADWFAQYRAVLKDSWARSIILIAMIEAGLVFGLLPFIGADLHLRFGLGYTAVGLIVACFGVGGLFYSASVHLLLPRLGQPGMARGGGVLLAAMLLILATAPVWWFAPLAVTLCGYGFFMLHNTLQTTATQMTPQARVTAIALFSAAIYFGQTIAVSSAAPIVDRCGAPVVFVAGAAILLATAFWFAAQVARRSATSG